jgi:hypothetical protein
LRVARGRASRAWSPDSFKTVHRISIGAPIGRLNARAGPASLLADIGKLCARIHPHARIG